MDVKIKAKQREDIFQTLCFLYRQSNDLVHEMDKFASLEHIYNIVIWTLKIRIIE